MASITQSIDVNVPVRTAYDQWTQFESFPQFMHGVKEVHQLDDTRLHWVASIGGKTEEWNADITEQTPDQRIAWRSEDDTANAGVVTFHRLDTDETRVTLQMEWQPQSMTEKAGASMGMDDRQVKGDLERFKTFIEERGTPTGSWRGSVNRPANS